MIEKILLVIWAVWLLMILIAAFRTFGFLIARRAQDRRWKAGMTSQKPAVLIIPVKGFDLHATPRFFDAVFSQTYHDYRVIVCFESWDEPVAQWLCEHLELSSHDPIWHHPDPEYGMRSITLVAGGIATDEGQKVHNQRAALRELTSADEIIAFADADILCSENWLARLLAPINVGGYAASTTYRWLIPKRPTLANQVASVINASITTQGGAPWSTFLWGGSMALDRKIFDELKVPELLVGSLNDDLRLSKVVRAAGHKVAFVRSVILPTPIDFTWRQFFEFARRQYTQVKFFSPILYTGVNFVLTFYVFAVATIIAALVYGYFFAWVPIAAAYVIDQFRALARQQVYLSLFQNASTRSRLFAAAWLEHMLTSAWISLHWLLLASTWTKNRITWAGVRYRILSKSKTRILSRADSSLKLPAGAPGLAMISALRDRVRSTSHPALTERLSAAAEKSHDRDTLALSSESDTTLLPGDEVSVHAMDGASTVVSEESSVPTGVIAPTASAEEAAPLLLTTSELGDPADSIELNPLTPAESEEIEETGEDSAVLPLTTAGPDLSLHKSKKKKRKKKSKGSHATQLSTAEAILQKTRILSSLQSGIASPSTPLLAAHSTLSPHLTLQNESSCSAHRVPSRMARKESPHRHVTFPASHRPGPGITPLYRSLPKSAPARSSRCFVAAASIYPASPRPSSRGASARF